MSLAEARMWSVILLLVVPSVLAGENEAILFDVTTIFKARNHNGVARVHSRTNALGLPLTPNHRTDKLLVTQNQHMNNITCDAIENTCGWKLNDWSYKQDDMSSAYVSPSPNVFYSYNNFKKLKTRGYGMDCEILFTSHNSEPLSGVFHIFQISTTLSTNAIFNKNCKKNNGFNHQRTIFIDGQQKDIISCRDYDGLGEVRNEIYSFNFDDYISGYKGGIHWGGNSYWRNDVPVKYIYFTKTEGCTLPLPVYSSGAKGGEIFSPEINVDSTQMCLLMIFKYPGYNPESVFEVFAQDPLMTKHYLQTINSVKRGWNIVHANLTIPDTIIGKMKLVIKKTTDKDILVLRISNCKTEGEDVELLPTPESTKPFSSSLYTATDYVYVAEPVTKQVSNENTTICLNGGEITNAGCACRPGFVGTQCQLGCGSNRFGHDCGGLCSLRSSECEGLMMCTQPTGCHCGPGYKGSDCKTKCSDGWYGNDCSQRCSHCASSSCDIYTGECTACEAGYLPPHCRYESVYYPDKPVLSSPEYGTVQVTFDPNKYVAKFGTPTLFQLLYKDKNDSSSDWKIYITENIPTTNEGSVKEGLISEKIEGLRSGINYEVKVLLMDENFYKYDGHLIKTEEITTKCKIPQAIDYNIEVTSSTGSLIYQWNYDNTSLHGCPVVEYEVTWKEYWQWFTNSTKSNIFNITDLLPGAKIIFKVRAKTSGGFAPYSSMKSATTIKNGPLKVRKLQIESRQSTSAEISWTPPIEYQVHQLQYRISYKCVDQPSCSSHCQNISEGQMTVGDTRVTLTPLAPFTRYLVTVSPLNGKEASIYVGTLKDVPTEIPTPSSLSPLRTNTSVTVFWDQPEVCSGYLLGYNYQLVKEAESVKALDSGFTKETSKSFHNLTASTQYIVRVFVNTVAGWNPKSFLAINVSTSATVPEAVRNLTVYKRGKGMLGLRWAPPRAIYGKLKSFTVSYTLGQTVTSRTIEPTPCVVWPELYCYTIEGLRSNRLYNVSVSARNIEVSEEGEVSYASGITKESSPTAPQNLKLVNSSSTSILLQWDYPEMANGIVRTFVISVEETENYDQENCCQIYPLVETQVKDEAKTYETEVSGLHPASTYFVSVSAKTVGMGPSQSLSVFTKPPNLPLNILPRVEVPSLEEVVWLPQQSLADVNNSEIYKPLIKGHILLAVLNESQPIEAASDSGITDPQLNDLLAGIIENPFYFVAEYNQEDVVTVAGSLESAESVWGHPPPSLPPLQKYQLLAVQISDYNGVFNVDMRVSQPFTLAY